MKKEDWENWVVKAIRSVLRKRLDREPTEEELVADLPLFMCRHIEEEHPDLIQ